GGTLALDFTADTAARVNPAANLTLGSGTLAVTGNGAAPTTQALGNVTLAGGGKITVTTGQDQPATLALGGITPNPGSSLNVRLVNTGAGVAAVTTTAANTTNGAANVLGG